MAWRGVAWWGRAVRDEADLPCGKCEQVCVHVSALYVSAHSV